MLDGKAASDGGEKIGKKPPFPCWDGGFFFAVLLPFTCDFAICSSVFQDSKALGGIRRIGSKDLFQVSGRAVFVPEGETGPFRDP